MDSIDSSHRQLPSRTVWSGSGLAPFSLVEHALCPLSGGRSQDQLFHEVQFDYTDRSRNRRVGSATVACPFGLSANDEMYLFGLLALTFSQPEANAVLNATPHWCLTQLGLVNAEQQQGDRYRIFREAMRRLSGVVYQNEAFFDPLRGEHRDVTFGLLKYSLPTGKQSSRAWNIIWDQQFFQFAKSTRGAFVFDFPVYRSLDPSCRRLYLLLQKIFYRSDHSPAFELRHLAVDVVGFSSSLQTKHIKQKLARCTSVLLEHDVIRLPEGAQDVCGLFEKRGKGLHVVRFWRGTHFNKERKPAVELDSPLVEPLQSIGLDGSTIRRVIARYKPRLVQEWSDITLAAKEQGRIRTSPQAFFMHYIAEAADNRTTPPDWWRELRKLETRRRKTETPAQADAAFDDYLAQEGKDAFDRVMQRIFDGLREAGQNTEEALRNAEHAARVNLKHQFLKQHPEADPERPLNIADILRSRHCS